MNVVSISEPTVLFDPPEVEFTWSDEDSTDLHKDEKMSVIVTDTGFAADDWTTGFVPMAERAANDCSAVALDVASDAEPQDLAACIDKIAMIRVDFPSFADGRGFTIAAQLRRMGFVGRLRARGHLIADQYAMARRAGFDEVEISQDLATRQPEDQWLARANWKANDYQARMRG